MKVRFWVQWEVFPENAMNGRPAFGQAQISDIQIVYGWKRRCIYLVQHPITRTCCGDCWKYDKDNEECLAGDDWVLYGVRLPDHDQR
jgi:hypothetical protein